MGYQLTYLFQRALTRLDGMHSEEGQTMAEYALILALVVLVAAAALSPLGSAIAAKIGDVTTQL